VRQRPLAHILAQNMLAQIQFWTVRQKIGSTSVPFDIKTDLCTLLLVIPLFLTQLLATTANSVNKTMP
jgi:hypothetical protein